MTATSGAVVVRLCGSCTCSHCVEQKPMHNAVILRTERSYSILDRSCYDCVNATINTAFTASIMWQMRLYCMLLGWHVPV
jgi:hypothetical protein